MTDDRSLERAARSWLELGPTEAPDHAVDAALLRIQTTAQERDWRVQLPRRNQPMTIFTRLMAAAIAIAVVAVGAVLILRPGGGVAAQPSPTPVAEPIASPRAEASPIASASPSPMPAITITDVGTTLRAGSYRVDGFAAPFSVRIPAGWVVSDLAQNGITFARQGDGTINVALIVFDKVYPDPCHTTNGPRPVGSGVGPLVAAFSSMPGFTIADVRDVSLGGATGKTFTISNSVNVANARCSGTQLLLGTTVKDGHAGDIPMFGGESDRFWVVDAAGTTVVVAVTNTSSILPAAQPVVDSLAFGN